MPKRSVRLALNADMSAKRTGSGRSGSRRVTTASSAAPTSSTTAKSPTTVNTGLSRPAAPPALLHVRSPSIVKPAPIRSGAAR